MNATTPDSLIRGLDWNKEISPFGLGDDGRLAAADDEHPVLDREGREGDDTLVVDVAGGEVGVGGNGDQAIGIAGDDGGDAAKGIRSGIEGHLSLVIDGRAADAEDAPARLGDKAVRCAVACEHAGGGDARDDGIVIEVDVVGDDAIAIDVPAADELVGAGSVSDLRERGPTTGVERLHIVKSSARKGHGADVINRHLFRKKGGGARDAGDLHKGIRISQSRR